ncbi:hypothetical protein GCM10007049_02010 [Echinicola pacifica]|uniref:Uncharacterized protein n=1 Tax=Echinicola pacifica TaxID=346377 RepID=A0A918UJ82_9BACT|nr:hypothetical protein [Echinicola pacifica]GGZ13794.1 hypothetical protein GCM10007049_02010 [Echinicola pacifica]
MGRILRNIIGVLAGLVIGSMVNMGIIMIGPSLIPPPEGVDMTTMEGLKEGMSLLSPRHYIMPFLAHALGTFTGAFLAAMIAVTYRFQWAILIGFIFLAGGITNIYLIPVPVGFAMIDSGLAYIPFAYLGARLALRRTNSL